MDKQVFGFGKELDGLKMIIGYNKYLKNNLCKDCIIYLDLDPAKKFLFCEKCWEVVGNY
jgi:hypothetical protein